MINRVAARIQRPERGWDPIPPGHAERYARDEWLSVDRDLVDWLEGCLGGLRGRRVLDLGAGPGQFSAEFARRGAQVTWHDVSVGYRLLAHERLLARGLAVRYSLGYLEDARRLTPDPFDLVFVRLCWNYAMDDRAFGSLVHDLTRPGGILYVDSSHETHRGGWRELAYHLNAVAWIKVGHPPPPPGRVAALLGSFDDVTVVTSRTTSTNDRVLMRRLLACARPDEHSNHPEVEVPSQQRSNTDDDQDTRGRS